jgi:biopolymer transport protein TolR
MIKNPRDGVLHEINVTPFVDVMLVLLIIFMVSAPLMQTGVNVNLPVSKAGQVTEGRDRATLVLRANKQIELNQKVLNRSELKARLSAMVKAKPDLQVLVQADRNLSYGFVAAVMGDARSANVQRLGLMTEPGE